ncbi:unnamed protein product [Caenorhabditis brenneri]
MDEINQAQSDELTRVSEGVPVQPSTATPTTIAHIIDPKTTLADSLDKTYKYKICGEISSAKEDKVSQKRRINEETESNTLVAINTLITARSASEHQFEANAETLTLNASLTLQSGNELSNDVSISKVEKKAASDFAFTVARGMDLLATVADCSDIPNREPTFNHIDPAKEIGIGAARTRSEAYLAKKENTKNRDHKVDSVLNANYLSTYSVDATSAAGNSNRSSKNDVQGQISPAQSDEIEAARIRMEAYLAKTSSQTLAPAMGHQNVN